jgi:hypothetical protein
MQEVQSINSLSGDLTTLILPWIAVLVSAIIAFMLKDFVTNFAKGMAFQMNRAFNEGDKVILDGSDAIIVKVGMKQTVFGVFSDKGYTWRYVPNERIPFLKLEKVVDPELHKDSEEVKGRRLQRMIDSVQDEKIDSNHDHIAKNAEEIDKLKNKDDKN